MIITLLTLIILTIIYYERKISLTIKLLKEQSKKDIESSLNKSRHVIKGQVSEQLVPFMKGFPYNAADLKFFGNSFDYICLVNMAESRDSDEVIKEVVFLDIKTGNSQLSKVQRKIRDAIVDGRVAWETVTVNEDNSVTIKRAKKKSVKFEKGLPVELDSE